MRKLFGFCAVLLLCGLAAGQNDWVPPGTYAQPSALRVTTPSASAQELVAPFLALDSPSLAAGATSRAPSSVTGPSVHFNQPLWYAPGAQFAPTVYESPVSPARAQVSSGAATSRERSGFEFGAATFQSSYGAAQLVGDGLRRKTKRVYTNPDVTRQ